MDSKGRFLTYSLMLPNFGCRHPFDWYRQRDLLSCWTFNKYKNIWDLIISFCFVSSCRASSLSCWVLSPSSMPRRPNIFRFSPHSCAGSVRMKIILQYFLFSIQLIAKHGVLSLPSTVLSLLCLVSSPSLFCLHQHIFPFSRCLPPFLSSRPPSPVWLPRSGPSIMVRSCSVSLIPISSHSSAWQPWQPVPSLIGPSLTGRRVKINRPSWVRA